MKYTKPYSELEEFKLVDVITTSGGETGGEIGGGNDGDLPPDFS